MTRWGATSLEAGPERHGEATAGDGGASTKPARTVQTEDGGPNLSTPGRRGYTATRERMQKPIFPFEVLKLGRLGGTLANGLGACQQGESKTISKQRGRIYS